MLIGDGGGTSKASSAPATHAPAPPRPPTPEPLVYQEPVEYLLDVDFSEPAPAPTPEPFVYEEPVFVSPTTEQLANRSSRTFSGSWGAWSALAQDDASRGGDWGDPVDVTAATLALGESGSLGARWEQAFDGAGHTFSLATLGNDLSSVGNGLNSVLEGDLEGAPEAAQGGLSAASTIADLYALASKSSDAARVARVAGGVAGVLEGATVGVPGAITYFTTDDPEAKAQARDDIIEGALKGGGSAAMMSGNPYLMAAGAVAYGGGVYWESHETYDPYVQGAYREIDEVNPLWLAPLSVLPTPLTAAVLTVKYGDDAASAVQGALSSLPKLNLPKKPW